MAAAAASSSIATPHCTYTPPMKGSEALKRLITQSKTAKFADLILTFNQSKPFCHVFDFKFPLEMDPKVFVKVLYIDARQPNKFDPSNEREFIEKTRLGFMLKCKGEEAKRDYIFIDKETNSTINVDEQGLGAQLNQVVEEDGNGYIRVTVLGANDGKSGKVVDIAGGMECLGLHFSKMHDFARTEDVEQALSELEL